MTTWPRPVPLVGDTTSAAERAADVTAWALPEATRAALHDVIARRRDIRRYRPDPVPPDVLERVLTAAHRAPSVGHSQPWRFLVVREPATRDRAARMADEQRLRQAAQLEPDAARRLLDLQLEGIREAPTGIVVACDRRAPATGVLGRATFPDADLWSCACAIENLWLAARAEGLGVGWVTLFDPAQLAALLQLPEGVVTLGWLCLGWPDERPPEPGLERAGWSRRQPLSEVVFAEGWPAEVAPPVSHLRAPAPGRVVGARDDGDARLAPPGSLGVLDRSVDRVLATGSAAATATGGCLVVAAGRHRVTAHGVSAYPDDLTDELVSATLAGVSAGAAAAGAAGLRVELLDGGTASGDLVTADALTPAQVRSLLASGRAAGASAARDGLIALGEIGIGNTTVAAALACVLLGIEPDAAVGLGAGADSATLERKRTAVTASVVRARARHGERLLTRDVALAALGGPELALLCGVVEGAAAAGSVVVLDGLATGVAALLAVTAEPGVAAYLVAGQRSRERAHAAVLERLGLEPLLDLRLRAGEGVGAALAVQLLRSALAVRRDTARTS